MKKPKLEKYEAMLAGVYPAADSRLDDALTDARYAAKKGMKR